MIAEIFNFIWMLMYCIILLLIVTSVCLLYLRYTISKKKAQIKIKSGSEASIAFYHPLDGNWGEKERTLFLIISSILKTMSDKQLQISIYTSNIIDIDDLCKIVRKRFGIKLQNNNTISMVSITSGYFLGQPKFLKNIILYKAIWNALSVCSAIRANPSDIFFDTSGVEFAYPLVKLLCPSIKLLTFINSPSINSSFMNSSNNCRFLRSYYYPMLTFLYKVSGYFVDDAITNSSFIKEELKMYWGKRKNISIVCPSYSK